MPRLTLEKSLRVPSGGEARFATSASTFSFHSMKVEFCTEKPLWLRRTLVLPLQCDAKTKCYNFKDCNPLYIHLPEKKKMVLKATPAPQKKNFHMPLFI